jgi:hypothetical protein
MTLFGAYVVGTNPPEASSSRSPVERSRIVEGSLVTLQYGATLPGSTGIDWQRQRLYSGPAGDRPSFGASDSWNETRRKNTVELSPEAGFGTHDDEKTMNIPKSLLPPGVEEGDSVQNDLDGSRKGPTWMTYKNHQI